MDSKRVPVAQVATAVPKAGIISKTNVGKTTSEASMTPSQMAAAEASKARKHPLDALSRSVFSRNMEKRSGLQDVDDEFLKQNFFSRPGYGRHSGLNEGNMYASSIQNQHAAGQPSGMVLNAMNAAAIQQQQQQMAMQPPVEGQPQVQYMPMHAVPMQQMSQQPPMQQQMAQPPMQNAMQMNPTIPAAGQPTGMANPATLHGQPVPPMAQSGPQMHPTPSQHSQQIPISPSQVNAAQNMQQQQMLAQQQQQQQPPPQNIPQQQMQSPVPPSQPEPDMCTTCPNCQTTIYLVRPDIPEMQQIQQAVN